MASGRIERFSAFERGSLLTLDEAREIAVEAYVWAYPLLLMELTRRTMTNVPRATDGKAPMNRIAHMRAFPDASFTDVVRPNVDTLYSMLWYDVTGDPLIVSVPGSAGRYYLLQLMDMWTDVFDSPGARTTGTDPYAFAIVGPGWRGQLPRGVEPIRSPTAVGWMIGRTQTNGVADYGAVHRFQDGFKVAPLSRWGGNQLPDSLVNPSWMSSKAPVDQLDGMDPASFFSLFAELLKANPPHENDYAVLHRLQRLGFHPGKAFHIDAAPSEAQAAIITSWPDARRRIGEAVRGLGVMADGWRTSLSSVGSYGTDYLQRAAIAYGGLGATPPQDAVHPFAFADAAGAPFRSDRRYVLHFDKRRLPPVRAFWSLTLYDDRQRLAANSINRYALGDRDPLQLNVDGSLDIFIQRQSPGASLESNWLPTPAKGGFTLNLRLYWPRPQVTAGDWSPPPVQAVH